MSQVTWVSGAVSYLLVQEGEQSDCSTSRSVTAAGGQVNETSKECSDLGRSLLQSSCAPQIAFLLQCVPVETLRASGGVGSDAAKPTCTWDGSPRLNRHGPAGLSVPCWPCPQELQGDNIRLNH